MSKKLIFISISLLLFIFGFPAKTEGATEVIGLVRQDCTSYSNCFTSLAAWEVAYGGIDFTGCTTGDLVCADKIAIAQIDGTWTNPDTTAVIIDGWITGPNNYIKIYTTPEARHNGKWDTGAYRLEVSNTEAIRNYEENVRIDGLQVYITSVSGDMKVAIHTNGPTGVIDFRVSNNIVRGITTAAYIHHIGIAVCVTGTSGSRALIWNNIAYDFNGNNNDIAGFWLNDSNVTYYAYNNTAYNSQNGFQQLDGTFVAKNNLAYNNTDNYDGTFHADSTNNLSGPTQIDAPGTNSRQGVTVTFVNETNKDFHLISNDAGARNYGTDLSVDADLAFSDDIDGQTRPGESLWDIGADEYKAPPNAPSSLGPSNYVDGSWGNDNTPTLQFTQTDPDVSDTVKFRIQIDDSSDYGSAVVDYTSGLMATGTTSFTVGQATSTDNGTYTVGQEGQTLSDGSYYWRVMSTDNNDATSSWTVATDTIAFKVDTTAPSTVSDLTSSSHATSTWSADNTIDVSWTVATDTGGSGVAGYSYLFDTTSDTIPDTTQDSTETSTTSSSQSDGSSIYFHVRVVDNVGNWGEASHLGPFYVDTAAPTSVDLDSPGDNSYTNSERPSFKWKATTDATAGLSKYVLEIDNGETGDFTIDDIPVSRATDYETNKYVIHYENFGDSDLTNNYISVYTKSSNEWSTDSNTGQNDGKLREGKVSWKVKAVNSAGNEREESRTLFVDRSGPSVEVTQINTTSFADNLATTDKTPTIYGKITDALEGDKTENRIASGPKEVEIKIEKKNYLGLYDLHTLSTVNLNENYWSSDGSKITDNSKNTSNKYSTFSYTPSASLPLGSYRITLTGKDKSGNTGSPKLFDLTITTLAELVTPEEEKIIEEVIEEELEIVREVKPKKLSFFQKAITGVADTARNIYWKGVDAIKSIGRAGKTGVKQLTSLWQRHGQFRQETDRKILAFVKKTYDRITRGAPSAIKDSLFALGKDVTNISEKANISFRNSQKFLADKSAPLKENTQETTYNLKVKIANTAAIWFDKEPTKIFEVKVAEVGKDYAVITWKTNHYATSKVNYGLTYDYGKTLQLDKKVKEHKIKIADLRPGTKYYYEVMSQNKNYVFDARHEFTTKESRTQEE